MKQTESYMLAKASFRVLGDTVDPDQWTTYFGMPPTVSGKKGEEMPRPANRVWRGRPVIYRTGIWSFDSRHMRADLLEPHLLFLIKKLGLPREDFVDLLAGTNATADMFCFWENDTCDRVPVVSDTTRVILKANNIKIEIDEYPQPVKFHENGKYVDRWI